MATYKSKEILEAAPWGQPTVGVMGEQVIVGESYTTKTKSFPGLSNTTLEYEHGAKSLAEMETLRDFFDARRGRKESFWLPSPFVAYRIAEAAASSATTLVVENNGEFDTGLVDGDRKLHLWIDDSEPVEVTEIAEDGDTLDLTITPALSSAYQIGTPIRVLYCGRLRSDSFGFRQGSEVAQLFICNISFTELQRETP
jgi:hypothetical protein